ncbi:MAG: hypothetical protein WA705_07085 [Candidatus Ozemobacteraceae bacterium]
MTFNVLPGIRFAAPRRVLALFACLFVLLIFVGTTAEALRMGERQIADFQKEAVRVMTELVKLPAHSEGDDLLIKLSGHTIRGLRVKDADVRLIGVKPDFVKAFQRGDADFEQLHSLRGVSARGTIGIDDLQAFCDRESAKQNPDRMVFQNVHFSCANGVAEVTGMANLWKVVPDPLSMLPRMPSPFKATVAVQLDGGKIILEPISAEINNQTMSSEFKAQIMCWLNPVWDCSKLPYGAAVEKADLTPSGIVFEGWLFGR